MFGKDSLPKTTTRKNKKVQYFHNISNRQVFQYSVDIPRTITKILNWQEMNDWVGGL